MKILFTALMLVSSMSSFACNLNEIKETELQTVTKNFRGGKFCLNGVYCTDNSAYEKAALDGYTNCKRVANSGGGLHGVTSSYNYTIQCEKTVTAKLSPKELRTKKCNKIFECSNEETGNTTLILEMFDKLKCEKYL